MTSGPRILLASDKFKGSLTSVEVSAALTRGLTRSLSAELPGLQIDSIPVADGGDGTLEVFLASGFRRCPVRVTGPDGQPADGAIAVRDGAAAAGGEAVVETASVAGLTMMPRLDAMGATSRGVGEALLAALDAGARRIVLGLGGSASTDGGAGMLQALGARCERADGTPIGPGAAGLAEVAAVDLSTLDPRLAEAEIIVASDVSNPLCGPDGAAAVYGPQKGATPDQVPLMDAALERWARLISAETAERPGAGAAGGLGYAAMAALGATMRPGIELVLEMLEFPQALEGADLVITGEGRLDAQSLSGKAPMGVLQAASRASVPVLAVCGASELGQEDAARFAAVHALMDTAPDAETAMRQAGPLLEELAAGPLSESALRLLRRQRLR